MTNWTCHGLLNSTIVHSKQTRWIPANNGNDVSTNVTNNVNKRAPLIWAAFQCYPAWVGKAPEAGVPSRLSNYRCPPPAMSGGDRPLTSWPLKVAWSQPVHRLWVRGWRALCAMDGWLPATTLKVAVQSWTQRGRWCFSSDYWLGKSKV